MSSFTVRDATRIFVGIFTTVFILGIVLVCVLYGFDQVIKYTAASRLVARRKLELVSQYAQFCSEGREEMFTDMIRNCAHWKALLAQYNEQGISYMALMRRFQEMGFCNDNLCDNAFKNITNHLISMLMVLGLGVVLLFGTVGFVLYKCVLPFMRSDTDNVMTLPGATITCKED